MFDSLRRALGQEPGEPEGLRAELTRLHDAIETRAEQLESKRASRLEALFPDGPVEGAGEGRFPGLAPINFEEEEPESWLVATATGIIDNFPGSAGLLSQLDATFAAFCEANHFRLSGSGGPYAELDRWRAEMFDRLDLPGDVPLFVSNGGGTRVLGCNQPLVVVDRFDLDGRTPDEQRFVLAGAMGHVFFGNLKIFAFYRLMEMFDKLPSMAGLISRGLGMIPGVGNTISKGLELARNLNNQVIRKTHLVVGQRQHVLCDRLASLLLGSAEAGQRVLAETALGGAGAKEPEVQARLVEQGHGIHERFREGKVDLTMLSLVGPGAPFAALRAYKLDAWERSDRAAKIRAGYYVTHDRLKAYRVSHAALEEEIEFLEGRLVELHEKAERLATKLAEAEAAGDGAPPAEG